jgi:hypothetical protein
VNRIDEIVVFHALDEKHIKAIAKIQLGYLEKRLAALEMRLEVTDAALKEHRFGRLRPDLRGAAAQAGDPAEHREPAVQGVARRPLRGEGHDPGGLRQEGLSSSRSAATALRLRTG